MQLGRAALVPAILLAAFAASPAQAGICSLVVLTPGTLAMSSSGQRIGSEESGAISATMTVGSIGASTLTVSAPTMTQAPAAHNQSGDILEVAYRGTGVLASVNQPYTSAQTDVAIPNLIGVVALTVDNRVTTSTGFAPGSYQTRTVVTCS